MLDLRTIVLLASLVYILCSVVVCSIARYRYSVRGLTWWAAGSCFSGLGFSSMVLRETVLPMDVSVVLSNVPVFFGFILTWHGMRRFVGQKRFSLWMMCGIGLILALTGFFQFWYASYNVNLQHRLLIYSFNMFLWTAGIAFTLVTNSQSRPMVKLAGYVYGVWALSGAVWFVDVVLFPGSEFYLMEGPVSTVLFSGGCIVFKMATVTGMILMLNEELQRQLSERALALRRETQCAQKALDAEQEALANNIRFADMISHEYRTPLSVISLQLDVLDMEAEKNGTPPPIEVELVRENVQRLEKIIQQALDMDAPVAKNVFAK